jgi:hypothetical protein
MRMTKLLQWANGLDNSANYARERTRRGFIRRGSVAMRVAWRSELGDTFLLTRIQPLQGPSKTVWKQNGLEKGSTGTRCRYLLQCAA